jgi:hypothetical protein
MTRPCTQRCARCPLWSELRTLHRPASMSPKCQKRTWPYLNGELRESRRFRQVGLIAWRVGCLKLKSMVALIIHFSGFKANEDRPERIFPRDLMNAITCSVDVDRSPEGVHLLLGVVIIANTAKSHCLRFSRPLPLGYSLCGG